MKKTQILEIQKQGSRFLVVHVPTGRTIAGTKLRREAEAIRKSLRNLEWSNPEALRPSVDAVLDEFLKEVT